MLLECHSPQPKCISFPICHPIINCCKCPTKCICITKCCTQTPSCINFKTDNCDDLLESKRTYEMSCKSPSSPSTNLPTNRGIPNQFRNSTPDIRQIYSKTNSYFNIDRNNSNDNDIHNIQSPINSNDNNNYFDDNNNYFENENDNNYNINDIKGNMETSRKSFSFRPNLSIARNNSINYTYRNLIKKKEFINNKPGNKKKQELLDKIKCISHRLDKTISIYKDKNNGIYNKNKISKNKYNNDYHKRFNSNENFHNIHRNKKNLNRYLDEINQILYNYDRNYLLDKN